MFVYTLPRITVRFSSNRYTGREDEEFIVVFLELSQGISAYPFNVTIIPSELSPVSAEGKAVHTYIATCIVFVDLICLNNRWC